jgi:hypothetical protein
MEEESFREILLSHISRYPLSEIVDMYKLVHQAALGSEHALKSVEIARARLERELDELSEDPHEPLIDRISPNGRIVRVHLRPYSQSGCPSEILLQAFIRTAKEYKGSVELLKACWSVVEYLATNEVIPTRVHDLRIFFEGMEENGFPAVHHSSKYVEAYKPSYRVVAREFLAMSSNRCAITP